MAARVGAVLDVPHVEIDGLFHGPGWVPRPTFDDDVRRLVARDAWVTEWQYSRARPVLAARADLVVWLDLPVAVVMRQVVRRTLRRRLRREVLWNGNQEPPLRTILTDDEHIVRWAWSTRHKTASLLGELRGQRPELPVVRLGSHAEAARWLAGPLADAARH
jgi:adenylate kinase family enzyme